MGERVDDDAIEITAEMLEAAANQSIWYDTNDNDPKD